ncbi:hypothetical protein BA953_21615 [Vibrio coralliilyticus]|uniref:hypothetical protein n=1 Tax=Vibrio coralliilyticus TaxID=190893 RepID=UPI0008106C9B|nr:hypothetical protein [Vibrio coralliilyticus]ANW26744.1 hypothetical protein BA953_21615 [Vibrio coralliilyticus]
MKQYQARYTTQCDIHEAYKFNFGFIVITGSRLHRYVISEQEVFSAMGKAVTTIGILLYEKKSAKNISCVQSWENTKHNPIKLIN